MSSTFKDQRVRLWDLPYIARGAKKTELLLVKLPHTMFHIGLALFDSTWTLLLLVEINSQALIGWGCTIWTYSYWLKLSDPTWPLILLAEKNNRLSLVELATCGSLLIGCPDICTLSFPVETHGLLMTHIKSKNLISLHDDLCQGR